MKALRHTKTGELYPMNEHLAKHEDIEFVELDKNMKVIEPEEVGPAAELPDAPEPAVQAQAEPEEKAEPEPEAATVADTATAEASKSATSRTRKKTATEGN